MSSGNQKQVRHQKRSKLHSASPDGHRAEELAELFLEFENKAEFKAFLLDFLTSVERKELWERWCIVDLLLSGVAQRDIRDELGISISKVTRGSRAIQTGTGAFVKLWQKRKYAQKS